MQRALGEGTVVSKGLFMKGKDTYWSGVLILAMGVLALALLVLMLILSSQGVTYDGRSVFEIDAMGFLPLAIMTGSLAFSLLILGLSNMRYGKKSRGADFSAGEARTFLVLMDKQVCMIGEVGYPCPKCGADMGRPQVNFCPECGHALPSGEEEAD